MALPITKICGFQIKRKKPRWGVYLDSTRKAKLHQHRKRSKKEYLMMRESKQKPHGWFIIPCFQNI